MELELKIFKSENKPFGSLVDPHIAKIDYWHSIDAGEESERNGKNNRNKMQNKTNKSI